MCNAFEMAFDCTSILCNKKFWNGFFAPRYPGVHIILLLVLLNMTYTSAYLLMAVYFDCFSSPQFLGYLMMSLSNALIILSGFLTIHFLSQKPAYMKLSYYIFLHVIYMLTIILGCFSIYSLLLPATTDEMRAYTKRNIEVYYRNLYMFRQLFHEKKCCGITLYGDVFPKHHAVVDNRSILYYRIPKTCCRNDNKATHESCIKMVKTYVNDTYHHVVKEKYFYQQPCFKEGESWSTVQNTHTFQIYLYTVYGVGGTFVFIFGILAVLNYYVWYRFPRVPLHLRPQRFNEDVRNFMKCKYQKLRKSLKEQEEAVLAKQEENHAGKKGTPSDFVLRHELIKMSLANMRNLHRDMVKADWERHQEEMRLRAAGSSTSILSRSSSPNHVRHNVLSSVESLNS